MVGIKESMQQKLKQIYGKSYNKFEPWIDENGCIYEEIVKPNMIGLKEKDIERPYLNDSWWRPLELKELRIGDNFKD